jgi:hypothetical protein
MCFASRKLVNDHLRVHRVITNRNPNGEKPRVGENCGERKIVAGAVSLTDIVASSLAYGLPTVSTASMAQHHISQYIADLDYSSIATYGFGGEDVHQSISYDVVNSGTPVS